MNLSEALDYLIKNKGVKELDLTCNDFQEAVIRTLFLEGNALEKVTFSNLMLSGSLTSILMDVAFNHPNLQELAFKDCTFDGDRTAKAFREVLPKCVNLRRFSIDMIGCDTDLAGIVFGLAEQGKIEYFGVNICTYAGQESIAAIAKLIKQGSKPITLEMTSCDFCADLSPALKACEEVSRSVTWNIEDSESSFDKSQFKALQQLKPKQISQGSHTCSFHIDSCQHTSQDTLTSTNGGHISVGSSPPPKV